MPVTDCRVDEGILLTRMMGGGANNSLRPKADEETFGFVVMAGEVFFPHNFTYLFGQIASVLTWLFPS